MSLRICLDRFLDGLLVNAGQRPARCDQIASVNFDIRRLATHLLNPRLVDQDFA